MMGHPVQKKMFNSPELPDPPPLLRLQAPHRRAPPGRIGLPPRGVRGPKQFPPQMAPHFHRSITLPRVVFFFMPGVHELFVNVTPLFPREQECLACRSPRCLSFRATDVWGSIPKCQMFAEHTHSLSQSILPFSNAHNVLYRFFSRVSDVGYIRTLRLSCAVVSPAAPTPPPSATDTLPLPGFARP